MSNEDIRITMRLNPVLEPFLLDLLDARAKVKKLGPLLAAAEEAERLSHGEDVDLEGSAKFAFSVALGRIMDAVRLLRGEEGR